MSTVFSVRLYDARRDANLSQKAAAVDLGVSQALLSHYEKGIRECGMDFIVKAAKYYDLTADYLLGLSDTKRPMDNIFSDAALPSDGDVSARTLYRAVVWLCENTGGDSTEREQDVFDFISIGLYRAALTLNMRGELGELPLPPDKAHSRAIAAAAVDSVIMTGETVKSNKRESSVACPDSVKTIAEYCERIISQRLSSII